jgi:hypothetical protein
MPIAGENNSLGIIFLWLIGEKIFPFGFGSLSNRFIYASFVISSRNEVLSVGARFFDEICMIGANSL